MLMAAVLSDTDLGVQRTRADVAECSWGRIRASLIT